MIEFELDDGGLKKALEKLENLPEEQPVTFDKMFPPAFMAKYTDFTTIHEFVTALEAEANKPGAFWDVPDTTRDSFTKRQTRFEDWAEMKGKAGAAWMAQDLGLDSQP